MTRGGSGFALALVCAGCRFNPASPAEIDAPPSLPSIDAPAGSTPFGEDVPHVPTSEEYLEKGDLTLTDAKIDTTALTISVPLPENVTLTAAPQDPVGPEVALIHARRFTVTGVVTVVGSRALIVIAESIDVSGTILANARGTVAGPGGRSSSEPQGRGSDGRADGSDDSGGGGGGFAFRGANGGGTDVGFLCFGGEGGGGGGSEIGNENLIVLEGGGAGGAGSPGACEMPEGGTGGGGGGAIQLSAAQLLRVSGMIHAGGGGGAGGLMCPLGNGFSAGAGSGGGAGGAIYLDGAPIDLGGATLSANGGGGGGGACSEFGQAGADAGLGATAADGGAGSGGCSTTGGGRGAAVDGPQGGGNQCHGNSGGGGGQFGRIVFRGSSTGAAVSVTPTAVSLP